MLVVANQRKISSADQLSSFSSSVHLIHRHELLSKLCLKCNLLIKCDCGKL